MTYKPPNSRYTIIKVKISRKAKDAWRLGQLFIVLLIGLAAVAAVQVRLCRALHPSREILACLRPGIEARR